ncbi:hypothetical protein [Marinicella sp. W31]|uniref:hypothetical protein n=1 Tax=Marinicella sp. W31 TaxID=3023713 RepID=UPI0037573AE8
MVDACGAANVSIGTHISTGKFRDLCNGSPLPMDMCIPTDLFYMRPIRAAVPNAGSACRQEWRAMLYNIVIAGYVLL